MERNMSDLDRVARAIVAAVFAYLFFSHAVTGALGIVLLALAVVFVFSSVMSFCPVYRALNIGTFKKK
ncbi:MAG: DUF2892 domain-containing protein [Anaerolineales bacterium]|nr:DUF2892 domain-containing protein [Anaerolineales bacterium]